MVAFKLKRFQPNMNVPIAGQSPRLCSPLTLDSLIHQCIHLWDAMIRHMML